MSLSLLKTARRTFLPPMLSLTWQWFWICLGISRIKLGRRALSKQQQQSVATLGTMMKILVNQPQLIAILCV